MCGSLAFAYARCMHIAPYIVMYVGLALLFSASVLVLALEFMNPGGRVDRESEH
jgi:hypothetical protein